MTEVTPDLQQVNKHAPGMLKDVYLAAGVVVPGDADLDDLVAAPPGNCQDFDIKGPTGEGLIGEKVYGNRGTGSI